MRLLRRFLLGLTALLVITGLSATAFSYQYIYACGPKWSRLPVNYYINQNGSADIGFNTLNALVADSFDVWGEPCCSEFSASYQGTTQLTAVNNNGNVVLSWEEQSWDPRFGSVNQTIGVTLSQVYNNCTIATAPILFNGVGFTFRTNGQNTDMQSIVTHEVGHLLGLGHSSLQQATMYAAYIGGTGARTLHQDDQEGVCSLYTTSCSCNVDSDCGAGQECIGNRCEEIPCRSNSDCAAGYECDQNSGACVVPPCGSDNDCEVGFICQDNKCVSACPVCRTGCSTNAECGTNGFCVEDGAGGTLCLVMCANNGLCPGDSVCYQLQDNGQTYHICGSPDAQQANSLCPENYQCQLETPDDECSSNADCADGEECLIANTGARTCQPAADPCERVNCNEGEVCVDGTCMADTSNNGTTNNSTGSNNSTNDGGGGSDGDGDGDGGGGGSSEHGGGGEDEESVIIVFPETEGETQSGCCSSLGGRSAPSQMLVLLAGLALVFVRRRRQR